MTDDTAQAMLDVEQVVLRVARCSDQASIDDLLALFADDAVLDLGSRQVEGRAELFEFFGASPRPKDGRERTKHVISNVLIEVDGDAASAHSYFQVLRSAGLTAWGQYDDQLARVDGSWKIRRRAITSDGQAPRPA